MSTTKPSALQRLSWISGLAAGVTVALGLALLLARAGQDSTAAGVLTGALAVMALVSVGRWRTVRHGDRAGTAARVSGGAPDERDAAVVRSTLATVGWFAVLANSLAVAAMFLGADPRVLLSAMPFMLIGATVLAFVVTNRRR